VPIGKHLPELWVLTTEGVPQLSVAIGIVHCAMAQVSRVVKTILVGQVTKVGLMVSASQAVILDAPTVTVNEHWDLLLLASVAV
jgi:hypothetical protein